MPSYTLCAGHRAIIGGKLLGEGDKVTLSEEVAQRMVDDGVLEPAPARRTRKPPRRSAWTPGADDDADESDDADEFADEDDA